MSSSHDRLNFWGRGSVKSGTSLFQECGHVIGLENIAAKEDARHSRGRNGTDHIECVLVRGMAASTEHQNWYRTFFHHGAHGGYIAAVIRLNHIRTELGCH